LAPSSTGLFHVSTDTGSTQHPSKCSFRTPMPKPDGSQGPLCLEVSGDAFLCFGTPSFGDDQRNHGQPCQIVSGNAESMKCCFHESGQFNSSDSQQFAPFTDGTTGITLHCRRG